MKKTPKGFLLDFDWRDVTSIWTEAEAVRNRAQVWLYYNFFQGGNEVTS